jgi:DNA-directed RNA polymerase alpha subunit
MKNTARNEEVYHKRVVEKRTLQSVADEYGITRERVRQIVSKLDKKALWEAARASRPSPPSIMKDIWWSRRVYNCLYNEDLLRVSLSDFVEHLSHNRLMGRIPNMGKKSVEEICKRLEENGQQDISHLRSARNGENHRAS